MSQTTDTAGEFTGSADELRLPGVAAGAAIVVAAFGALALGMHAVAAQLPRALPEYGVWLTDVRDGNLLARLQWTLGDITEPQFYKAWPASAGLLIGALVAWWAGTRGKRWAGTSIAYGSGVWPWILVSSTTSLVLANLVFGPLLDRGWQPTFVPFVCVATSVVLVCGAGWPVAITGAVLGALTTPVAILLITYVTGPLGLPGVVANTAAMSIGAVVVFLLARTLPWMRLPAPDPLAAAGPANDPPPATTPSVRRDMAWTVRRVIVDFTETQFYATEWASVGVLVAVVLTFCLNPDFAAYGSGLLPSLLFAQALTAAIGILVWRQRYRRDGWVPTYASVVSVAPAVVLAFDGNPVALVLGAMGGALVCPLIARPISSRLPHDFHPFIGNTVAMAVTTALVVGLLRMVIAPVT